MDHGVLTAQSKGMITLVRLDTVQLSTIVFTLAWLPKRLSVESTGKTGTILLEIFWNSFDTFRREVRE